MSRKHDNEMELKQYIQVIYRLVLLLRKSSHHGYFRD
jgi:hypothetical protein